MENSGYQAIELAILKLPRRWSCLAMTYYAAHREGANTNSDHPEQMGNADDVEDWPDRFFDLRDKFADI